ncbi:hypothetical protein [Hymenobacter sp. YC55]|uniref:hypothetical protein n=1 Tax=Hymenobacter sp. YC55 TaxID=3034019 RepID=UPI0023F7C162|nr:hypothetical protein [Hymenobacter sp. YC55]MDF7815068.1 hypothetical protein [Hymenobacter sp. YC55]
MDARKELSYDVTDQVLARRQVEQLNQALEGRVQERTTDLPLLEAAAHLLYHPLHPNP